MSYDKIKDLYNSIFKSYEKPCFDQCIKKIKDLENYLPSNSTFFSIVNSQTMGFEYVTKNFKTCLGLDPNLLKQKGLKYFWARMHPDDLKVWIKAMDHLMEFTLENIDKAKRSSANYTWNYRLKKADGVYVNIVQNTSPLAFDSQGKPVVGLAHYTVMNSHVKIDMTASIKILNAQNEYETIYFNNFSQKKLFTDLISRREYEVVRFLALNYSSKEISEKLNISSHTVDTHRRNILKKLNISSTGELVGMLKMNKDLL